jgi:hypothetical protein
MSDLVERLRRRSIVMGHEADSIYAQAADRIERLEALVRKIAGMKLTDEMTDYEFHEVLFADTLDNVIREARTTLAKETE